MQRDGYDEIRLSQQVSTSGEEPGENQRRQIEAVAMFERKDQISRDVAIN